jgi:hypothetical protein
MYAGASVGRRRLGFGTITLGLVGLVLLGAALAYLPSELRTYLLLLVLTALAALWFIPWMARTEPTLTVRLLGWALTAKLAGSLARYLVFEVIYRAGGDAANYHAAGAAYAPLVRAFDFSFVDPPYVGTVFIENAAGVLYAFTGPTLPGAFLVFSVLAFLGAWFFYRAHRTAFPDGDHRLFALFIFFFPTMVFWPSSLGKDALIVFGLGLATYGTARLVRRISGTALLQIALGAGVTFAVRPGVAAVFLFGATVAFVLHPGRLVSPLTRPIAWILLGPALIGGLWFTVRLASQFEGFEASATGAQAYYTETSENLASGGSAFQTTASPTSPAGAAQAAVTVLFRPFPWEAGSPQEALAALESLGLGILILWRIPASLRALRGWRRGMIIGVVATALGITLALGAFSNAGALARQRAQLLPFAFMIFTAAAPKRRSRTVQEDVQPVPLTPVPAPSA